MRVNYLPGTIRDDVSLLEELLREAKFYQMPELEKHVCRFLNHEEEIYDFVGAVCSMENVEGTYIYYAKQGYTLETRMRVSENLCDYVLMKRHKVATKLPQ